jgi:hypothetical protein
VLLISEVAGDISMATYDHAIGHRIMQFLRRSVFRDLQQAAGCADEASSLAITLPEARSVQDLTDLSLEREHEATAIDDDGLAKLSLSWDERCGAPAD